MKGRIENIFTDELYSQFAAEITRMLRRWKPKLLPSGIIIVMFCIQRLFFFFFCTFSLCCFGIFLVSSLHFSKQYVHFSKLNQFMAQNASVNDHAGANRMSECVIVHEQARQNA